MGTEKEVVSLYTTVNKRDRSNNNNNNNEVMTLDITVNNRQEQRQQEGYCYHTPRSTPGTETRATSRVVDPDSNQIKCPSLELTLHYKLIISLLNCLSFIYPFS
jgi:hypothetical protein